MTAVMVAKILLVNSDHNTRSLRRVLSSNYIMQPLSAVRSSLRAGDSTYTSNTILFVFSCTKVFVRLMSLCFYFVFHWKTNLLTREDDTHALVLPLRASTRSCHSFADANRQMCRNNAVSEEKNKKNSRNSFVPVVCVSTDSRNMLLRVDAGIMRLYEVSHLRALDFKRKHFF